MREIHERIVLINGGKGNEGSNPEKESGEVIKLNSWRIESCLSGDGTPCEDLRE